MSESAAPVLIVEDERIIARDLQRTLRSLGYDAFAIAASCEEALARAAEKTPAVVLMDIRIQGDLDGIATARELQARFASTVVYLTSHADPDTLRRATATDPAGYLQKPVRPAELRSALEISLHKHRSEARGRDRERWVDAALSLLLEAVLAVDADGRVLECNPSASELLGRPGERIRGTELVAALAGIDTRGELGAAAERALRGADEEDGRAELVVAGATRRIGYRSRAVRAADGGRVLGAVLTLRGEDARAALDRGRRAREFAGIVERAPVGIIVHRSGKFVYANSAFANALGYDDPEQLLGRSILETIHPDARAEVAERIRQVAAGEPGVARELACVHRDGTRLYFEGTGYPLEFDGAPAVVAVVQDITARRAITAALQESESRYRHLFRESPTSMWEEDMSEVRAELERLAASGVDDVPGALRARPELTERAAKLIRILDVNDATLALYGAASREELEAGFERIFAPSTFTLLTECLCFLWSGKGGTFRAESSVLTFHGEPRDVDVRLTVAPGCEGSWARVVVSSFDTTAFKAAERELRASLREKDVLLKEVHHRVKNNLQVISSLLNLQAMQAPEVEVRRQLKASQSRVHAMALVHEHLYRSKDLSHVAFADYARALVADLGYAHDIETRGVEIRVAMEDVHLGVDRAIPCGLMLNELVSNAFKHAFPSERRGSVEVGLSRGGGRLRLSVRDDGVGLPSGFQPEQATSLGLDLVFTFADQLDAEVCVERGSGTRFSVSFSEG